MLSFATWFSFHSLKLLYFYTFMPKTLMIQGTSSDAGKSTVVTGLCRLLKRRGIAVAPFKPQNMALNSAVTEDGGEIGRAQAVQAQAAGLPAHTDMNPILIKPNSDTGAQIIVQGKVVANMTASYYQHFKAEAMAAVLDSYQRLSARVDSVIVEGAGSPAEINLRANDIANMGFAEAVDCPVLLVADIDRGGVFAQIVGTLALLSASEQQRIGGFIINRFRGDLSLLQPGLDWLMQRTGKPVFGVLPYLHGLHLEAEDAIQVQQIDPLLNAGQLRVVVPVLPRISNHTDFDSLRLHPQVDLQFVDVREVIPPADLIILPGSKNVGDDLRYLKANGWLPHLQRHLRYGGKLMGICGGYQMLGRQIHDPQGIEGLPGSLDGFGFLEIETTLAAEKKLVRVKGQLCEAGVNVEGYEIHAGVTRLLRSYAPFANIDGMQDGAYSDDRCITGTYIHGVFDHTDACAALLQWAGLTQPRAHDYIQLREQGIDLVADTLEQHLDLERILALVS